jgi:hypothetical protein
MGNAHSTNKTNNSLRNKNFKELVNIIDEINDLLHFYKTLLNRGKYAMKLSKYQTLSKKSLEYLEKINLQNFNEDILENSFDIKISNFYETLIFLTNIKDEYEKISIKKKQIFIYFTYDLLQLLLYSLSNHLVENF